MFANSRDVAAFFRKDHKNVLRDIRSLIADQQERGGLNFEHTPYIPPQNGQTYRSFDLTKDGFALLAMGITGPKGREWPESQPRPTHYRGSAVVPQTAFIRPSLA